MIGNDFAVGMRAELKKKHACGSSVWEITRTGADVKLKCTGCGRTIMLDRGDFMRAAIRILADENEQKV